MSRCVWQSSFRLVNGAGAIPFVCAAYCRALDRWMDGWTDGWMDRQTHTFFLHSTGHHHLWGRCLAYFKAAIAMLMGRARVPLSIYCHWATGLFSKMAFLHFANNRNKLTGSMTAHFNHISFLRFNVYNLESSSAKMSNPSISNWKSLNVAMIIW